MEIFVAILFISLLTLVSQFIYGTILVPVSVYSYVWGLFFIKAVFLQYSGRYDLSQELFMAFGISWGSFVAGSFIASILRRKIKSVNSAIPWVSNVNAVNLRHWTRNISIFALIFAVFYYFGIKSLIGHIDVLLARDYFYVHSAEISTQLFFARWYIYNMGIAALYMATFFSATSFSVNKRVSFNDFVIYLAPIISAVLVSLAELSRTRLLDILFVNILVYFSVKKITTNKYMPKFREGIVIVLLTAIPLFYAVGITSSRGILSEVQNPLLRLYANYTSYKENAIYQFDCALSSTYTEFVGFRAILYPIFYLFERAKIIQVGPFADPTLLTDIQSYPTPTYLFWLYSGFAWYSILIVPFVLGLGLTLLYYLQKHSLSCLWLLICGYLVILSSTSTWKLGDLWFFVTIVSSIVLKRLILTYPSRSQAN